MPSLRSLLCVGMLALLVAACDRGEKSTAEKTDGGRETPATAPASTAPAMAEIENAAVRGVVDLPDSVTLAGGRWEGEPYVAGGSSRPSLWLTPGFRLAGDLDGDGGEETVALLGASHGGSGELVHLAVFAHDGTRVRNVATALLGDRVQVRAARVEGNRVVVNVVQAGSGDAMCCPGETAERVWSFEAGALREETSATRRGRLSVADLGGVTWVLRFWDRDEPAPAEPEVTLRFDGDRATGSAGCNRLAAAVSSGDSPGDVSVSVAATTRQACGEPADSIESRFLTLMTSATKFSFAATRLVITYNTGGVLGTMVFEAKEH